jgi:hypothetical protein
VAVLHQQVIPEVMVEILILNQQRDRPMGFSLTAEALGQMAHRVVAVQAAVLGQVR